MTYLGQRLVLGLVSMILLLPQPGFTAGPPPIITVQPVGLSVPLNGTATFTVVVSSSTALSYQWYANGTNLIPGATLSTYIIGQVNQSHAADYSVKVVNGGGTVTSSNATLNVLGPPMITTHPLSQSATAGQNVAFSVSATGNGPLNYQWRRNGTPLLGATNATLTLNPVQSVDGGNYTVTVANSAGSVPSMVAILAVTNPPSTMSVAATRGLTSAGFSFGLSVPLGATYVIEASSNARDWTPIATNVAPTSSVVFTDTAAANFASRFYRVMVR